MVLVPKKVYKKSHLDGLKKAKRLVSWDDFVKLALISHIGPQ
jgi:hypothetical protein